jgi:MYXO-CTERM domain-containing protein
MVVAAVVLLMFACSGGGCSGCAACGIAAIPGGFPPTQTIPNSAQVRLTSSGIDYIDSNASAIIQQFAGGNLDFPVHTITQTVIGISIHICSDDHCAIHIDFDPSDTPLTITPTAPNQLTVHARARIHSTHGNCVPGTAGCDLSTFTAGAWPGTCDLTIDSTQGSRPYVGITAVLELQAVTGHPARDGYTRLVVVSVNQTTGEEIEDADFSLGGPFYCSLGNLGFVKNIILGQLNNQIGTLLNNAIGDNLCQRPTMYADGTTGCPTGTFVVGSGTSAVCRYGMNTSDECVSVLLGMDGQGDLGGHFLGGFSPGTHAPIELLLAAGGDGIAINQGMTVDMLGGMLSMDRTFAHYPGHNTCVPTLPVPPLPTIPQAPAFEDNVIPGTTTPAHLGIGLSEDYLNYAGYGLFDSGMLCIGTGTRLSQQLSTGLLSALVRSINALTFPDTNAAVAIAVRPQQPPHFTIGTATGDPLITVMLPHMMMDFYVWSTERYIRFMTYETDLQVTVDLQVMNAHIVPMITGVTPMNSHVTNSELLAESPTSLAMTLESVLHQFAGMLTSGISPIALPAVMGFNIDIPSGGIGGTASAGHNFLSLWANLSLAHPDTLALDTTLEVSDLVLEPTSMAVDEHWGETRNTAWLHFSSPNASPSDVVEYQYRVDLGPWSRWTRDTRIQIDDDVLLLQAQHQIQARSRIVGLEATTDATPAEAPLLVDILPPDVSLARSPTGMIATGDDIISEGDLGYRFRINRGEWTDWGTSDEIAIGADLLASPHVLVEVEARDEAGNVGRAQQALIRGIADPSRAAGGCGCRAVGDRGHGALALFGLVLVALVSARRRKERV